MKNTIHAENRSLVCASTGGDEGCPGKAHGNVGSTEWVAVTTARESKGGTNDSENVEERR